MLNLITVHLGARLGFDCYFDSLKTICNYDEQKANKVFKQKYFLLFKVW